MAFDLHTFATSDWFVAVAGLASIASLAISIVIYAKLWRINAQITLRARRAIWHRHLSSKRTQLAKLMGDMGANDEALRRLLVECRPILLALAACSPLMSSNQRRTKRTLRRVGKFVDGRPFVLQFRQVDRDELMRSIHRDLLEICQTLREEIAQQKLPEVKV